MEKLVRVAAFITALCFFVFCLGYLAIEVMGWRQVPVWVPKKDVAFRIDASFSPDRTRKILAAIGKWESAAAGCLRIRHLVARIPISDAAHWSEDSVPTIYNASVPLGWKRQLAAQLCPNRNSLSCLGVANCSTGDIFMVDDSDMLFETVMLHEIGHVLLGGLHSIHKQDLMYPTVGEPKEIGVRETADLHRLHCETNRKDNGNGKRYEESQESGKMHPDASGN
jgi:hypothetical protein